jgi:ribA/ribD-fused uncharacterized protein
MNLLDLRSQLDLCDYLAQGGDPKYVLFWGHRPSKDGAVSKTCFSQWFEAGFDLDGNHYPTAEHYMMAEKARLFADPVAAQRALAAATPGAAKAIGREIVGFDEDTWLKHRWRIVVDANVGKFSQNGALREFLLNTGDRVLVEASPVDSIWGIGLAADDPKAAIPNEWQGLNLLGFALMEVRARLSQG